MTFFKVGHRNLWGDYGRVLIAGIGLRQGIDSHTRLFDREAPIELERTGPFAPSIMLVGQASIVVTDECKQQINDDCPGLVFKPVVKKLIVMSDWEDWEWDRDEPEEYPKEGEPENYVMSQPHSQEAAAEIGRLWELCIDKGAWLDTDVQRAPWDYDLRIHLDSWNGQHLFWAEKGDTSLGQWIIVTEDGKNFLDAYDQHSLLKFVPCLVK
ncbi:MAG: hypothetical protein AAF483_28590 [Planctomycetota bacterium]